MAESFIVRPLNKGTGVWLKAASPKHCVRRALMGQATCLLIKERGVFRVFGMTGAVLISAQMQPVPMLIHMSYV